MKKYLLILILLFACSGYSALIERYVNTASTSGGDGTTNATTGDNRAYAGIVEWEAAEGQDLTDGGGDTMSVYCSGSTEDNVGGRLLLNGFTTSEDYNVTVIGDNDTGAWSTSHYRMDMTTNPNILSYEDYTVFRSLQIDVTVSVSIQQVYGNVTVDSCIFKGSFLSGSTSAASMWVYNTIFNGIDCNDTDLTYLFYNCTSTGRFIVRANTTCTLYNVIITSADAFLAAYEGNTLTVNYSSWTEDNAQSDIDSGANNRYNQTFSFVDDTNYDYHLESTDTGALDYGGNSTTGFGISYTDDIDGDTRTGTWDIGADEYVSAGGGWTHKINSVAAANMAKVNTVAKADIAEINQT